MTFDITNPLDQALLALAVTFVLWGTDKITDKDNMDAIGSLAPNLGKDFFQEHPNILPNINKAVRIALVFAGLVYFLIGIWLLSRIGIV